jgi:alpha-L-fucosidase 2
VSLATPLGHRIHVTDANEIIMEGSCPGEMPQEDNPSDRPTGVKFCAILYVQMIGANGTIEVLNDKMLKLHGVDSAVLLLASATSFEGPLIKPSESKLAPSASAFNTLSIARGMSYSQLKTHHIDDYQSLFERVSLQLSQGSKDVLQGSLADSSGNSSQDTTVSDSLKPTVDRILSFKDNEDPSLIELLVQFGRYLLISCSRPGTQISNLHGIWSNDTTPPWE